MLINCCYGNIYVHVVFLYKSLLILDSVGFKTADYAKIKQYIHFIRLFALSDKFGIGVAINDFLPKCIENRHCV